MMLVFLIGLILNTLIANFRLGRGYYKPFATRTPVLLFLLIVTFVLIALTEIAVRSLPAHTGVGRLGKVVHDTLNHNVGRDLERRQWSKLLEIRGLWRDLALECCFYDLILRLNTDDYKPH